MGTYKSIRILANTTVQEEIQGIYALLKEYNAEDCWRKFSNETKWWPDQLIERLRNNYPHVMFRVDYDGIKSQPEFFLGKEAVEAHWVQPYFPTKSKFNSGVKARKAHQQRAKEQREKEAAEAAAKKAAETEDKERQQFEELKLKYG